MLGGLFDSACEFVEDAVTDPIGTAVDVALAPVRTGVDIIDGLSEGEIRVMAIASLGLDVAVGMGSSELLEWYNNIK